MSRTHHLSVNKGAARIVDHMKRCAAELGIAVSEGAAGETLIDCGAASPGGIESGRLLAEACLGGLGHVSVGPSAAFPRWPFGLTVRSSQPVVACLGSQYAGWQLASGEGEASYFAMGSGPARALAGLEHIFADIGYADRSDAAVLVLETGTAPPAELVRRVAQDCDVDPADLTILFAPTQSLAGTVQIVGRIVEVALHKAHTLHFDLARIREGVGTAPLPPPHPDFVTAMGRTNDAVIYGGEVVLYVSGPAADARALAEGLPSSTCADHGRPFAEIFRAYEGDFYKIDASLFSPAAVSVVALETGETFRGGRLEPALVDASFGA
ncbi:methenyltetrahydromethanopterin cyclohydrolase [Antarcticirhabdus aurantiaca]|uniref:Methenyltetrahydromethanopterin cyclohydrolase n=1 Tax=Antarcticirhabdus aurantiaca TaxID=2606717 RepID=A0ACD4NIW5_9HYPH|nr:methenyltetrahydromethanopterin cyclohydrolase [Antarcticirhabdus aurantiaca]WAJ26787.1 methenyltetrahydromethanopterin cyclohydrolase [Jeongeuplla avenae]